MWHIKYSRPDKRWHITSRDGTILKTSRCIVEAVKIMVAAGDEDHYQWTTTLKREIARDHMRARIRALAVARACKSWKDDGPGPTHGPHKPR